ncbi:hypothetical protein Dimus_012318 [Dionaea muscipula]
MSSLTNYHTLILILSHISPEPNRARGRETSMERHRNRSDQGKKIMSKESTTVRSKNEPLRVKYISSPIFVNARSESEFRALVQELTGKDADHSSPNAESSCVRDHPTLQGTEDSFHYTSTPALDYTFWRDFSKDQ